jgi:uncharacterized protein YqjF (DUF2071 family)
MPEASFSARYRPEGRVRRAQPGSLEHFLVERYCLYAEREGALERTDIHHRPWPLQPAGGKLDAERQLTPQLSLPREQPLLHYAKRLDVLVWKPCRADATD